MPDEGKTGGQSLLPYIPAIGPVANAISTGIQNKKARKFTEKMYDRQRADSLADWTMQNQYNSPEAQMARLKAAGLNPNLVYGTGATANTSQQPRGAQGGSYNQHVPQIDTGEIVSGFLNTKISQAQVSNLELQRELMQQELKNKRANEFKTYADTALKQANLTGTNIKNAYAPRLAEISLDAKVTTIAKAMEEMERIRAQTRLTEQQTQFSIQENERRQLTTGMTLRQGAEKILLMKQQELTEEIKRYNMMTQAQRNTSATQKQDLESIDIRKHIENTKAQLMVIEQTREKLKAGTDLTKEQLRILQSTPDWNDQRTIDMLESLLNKFTAPGTQLNPKMYRGFRQ